MPVALIQDKNGKLLKFIVTPIRLRRNSELYEIDIFDFYQKQHMHITLRVSG